MNVFVVTMYRYGDTEKHSYVLGAWSNKKDAENAGKIEETYRGDKYLHKITPLVLNANEFQQSFLDLSDIGSRVLLTYPKNQIIKFKDGCCFHSHPGLSPEEKANLEHGVSTFSFLLKTKLTSFNKLASSIEQLTDLYEPRIKVIYDVLKKAEELCQKVI